MSNPAWISQYPSERGDAQDAYFLSNQLQSFDPTKYYNLLPGVIGRRVLPIMKGVGRGAPVAKWRETTLQGAAKKGTGRSRSEPTVSVKQIEVTQAIKKLDATQQFTTDEVAAAREANESLPEDTQRAAVSSIEQQIDAVLCTGDALSGIPGLENNTNVTADAAGTAWAAATPAQILANLTTIVTNTMAALRQAQFPGSDVPAFNQFTLFLPEDRLIRLATLQMGTTNETSVLTYVKENFYMIKSIQPWHRLTKGVLAPALDSGVVNPMAAEAILPLDYDQLAPQFNGFNIVIPCWGRCGGVAMRYPVAFRYLTGL